MPRWLVTQGESQFSASDLSELKTMAAEGRIRPADLIQPPGASDWLYALELPELKAAFPSSQLFDDDEDFSRTRRLLPRPLVAGLLSVVIVGGIAAMVHFKGIIDASDVSDSGLSSGEAMLNSDVEMRSEPSARGGSVVSKLEKGDTVSFKLKQMNLEDGNWWLVSAGGKEGWIPAAAVPPNYLFDDDARKTDKALYFPEDFVSVGKEMKSKPLKESLYGVGADDYIRIESLTIANTSDFEMTDVIIAIESWDNDGNVIERIQVELDEPVPPRSKDLPVGAIFPSFELPVLSRPIDKKRAKKMDGMVESFGPGERQLLNGQCIHVRTVFNMDDIMEQIDYASQDEIQMLVEPLSNLEPEQRPEMWKPCFDIDNELYTKDTDQVVARIYQVRANPVNAKKK